MEKAESDPSLHLKDCEEIRGLREQDQISWNEPVAYYRVARINIILLFHKLSTKFKSGCFFLHTLFLWYPMAFLRVYPMRFARQLVDMRAELISDKFGAPDTPEQLPTALHTFSTMPWDSHDQWPHSDLASVYNYLRGSKHLRIPSQWETHLPKRI